MSREDLSNFIHSAEHSLSIREELKACKSKEELVGIAKKYGFSITLFDLENEFTSSEVEQWFKKSQINPFKFHESRMTPNTLMNDP